MSFVLMVQDYSVYTCKMIQPSIFRLQPGKINRLTETGNNASADWIILQQVYLD